MPPKPTRLPEVTEEDERMIREDSDHSSEESGEDLFDEDMARDYEPNERLDNYDESQLDNQNYDRIDPIAREEAEKAMRKRDRQRERRMFRRQGIGETGRGAQSSFSTVPKAYGIDLDSEGSSLPLSMGTSDIPSTGMSQPGSGADIDFNTLQSQSGPHFGEQEDGSEGNVKIGVAYGQEGFHHELTQDRFDLTTITDPREAFLKVEVKTEALRQLVEFLVTFNPEGHKPKDGNSYYADVIKQRTNENKSSIEVRYDHLYQFSNILALFLLEAPKHILAIFDDAATHVVMLRYKHYYLVASQINVRISNLVIEDPLATLRQKHLDSLIRTSGVVTRRSGVFTQAMNVKFTCLSCQTVIGPFNAIGDKIKIQHCEMCGSKGPFLINEEGTVYRRYQRITLQESPNTLEPGRLPRSKEVVLVNDLIDSCKPGEEIEVIGIYVNQYDAGMNRQNGFPVFSTRIEANRVALKQSEQTGAGSQLLTDEEEAAITELSKKPDIAERIFASVAPSVYGNEELKRAVCLAMVGGTPGDRAEHRIRGDINVLIVGDPATAKSQILKWVELTGSRVVRTTGRGASAVGLTAAVRKDPLTGEWTLEGGALVLANEGICLIDEFDKMTDKDRTSLYEAMEQQTISISKAGIVAVLKAECSVIAAANPIGSKFNPQKTFEQNLEMNSALLSRFDLQCIVRDKINKEVDERMADFVMKNHRRQHPDYIPTENDPFDRMPSSTNSYDIIPQHILKKYLQRAHIIQARLPTDFDEEMLKQLYPKIRTVSNQVSGTSTATPRDLNAILRISVAFAKLRLSPQVTMGDVNNAVKTFLHSFISTQTANARNRLRGEFSEYIRPFGSDNVALVHLLRQMEQEAIKVNKARSGTDVLVEIRMGDFSNRAREQNLSQDIDQFIRSKEFKESGFNSINENGVLKLVHRVILK
ncbi:putative DNA replication licensing factor MCM2 [Blattamonas nauphoetae]|uniref:DNA replication licensing factor MCM2 n=1 Tax=Blattamonas nauphoetae TaxID=2049346 RepID=A0ABQ9Y4Q8_9EUKA|nr:putative DNA replication licensing factor MCM2 [Blattamonas nauphoetae]